MIAVATKLDVLVGLFPIEAAKSLLRCALGLLEPVTTLTANERGPRFAPRSSTGWRKYSFALSHEQTQP